MSRWDYRNIGASAKPENKKLVEKIFEYIGYAKGPDLSEDGDGPSFSEPDVYGCWYSANSFLSGKVRDCFDNFYEYDLLFLLNALFPNTNVYVHSAEGNNTSDTWETHDVVFDTGDMTCYRNDSYTDYGGSGPSGNRFSKERFILRPPELEFISALIKISKEDGNTELTNLLLDLESKVKDGLIVYEDDGTDQRKNGQQYDVVDEVVDNTEDEDDIDDAYFDYVIGRMPHTVFNDLYRVKSSDSNSFDEEDYKLILGDLLENLDTEFRPFDMIYGDFVDWLKDNECVTALNEEEYKKAREKAEKLDIVSLDEFRLQRFGVNAEEEEDEEAYEDDEEDYSDEDDDRD